MASADALRRRLESLRFRGKWADVKGVAEDNDAEFRGAFEHVVFAILDPLGTGNLGPFKKEFVGVNETKLRYA